MVSSLFYYYIFKDSLAKIPDKYFLNIRPKDYELFSINCYFYDKYYHLFKKDTSTIYQNFNNNIYENIKYYLKLIKDNNYNKEGIILLYAYLAYLVINKYDRESLENYYFLANKIAKKEELKKLTYFYYDLRKPYYLFLDLIARHILKYPDIESFLKKASLSCFHFNKYFIAKESKAKNYILNILGKINHKNYLRESLSYKDLKQKYNNLIDTITSFISVTNDALYYNKDKDLLNFLNTNFI